MPAVTKVDEWTRDDTGVGAAIAAGSQALNGICALLVHEASIIINRGRKSIFCKEKKFHDPSYEDNAIDIIIDTSPIRFLKIVIVPAFNDELFW